MNEPLISVIVPIYKAEKYLHECVDSILAQTYTNLEIILVNDGSPDDSGRICDDYAAKDSRVKVIHKENGGVSGARNAGLDIAKGEYIEFVDSDDTIDADMVELLYKAIMESGAQMAVCGYKKIYADYTREITVPLIGFVNQFDLCLKYVQDFRKYMNVLANPYNKLFNICLLSVEKTLGQKIQIRFPEDMTVSEDMFFNCHCIDNLSNGIVFVNITPYHNRLTVNCDSLTKNMIYKDQQRGILQWANIMKKYVSNSVQVDNIVTCQSALFIVTGIHHQIITVNQKSAKKLKFSQLRTILKYATASEEKLSALVMYFFPDCIYRLAFKIFAKQSRVRGEIDKIKQNVIMD